MQLLLTRHSGTTMAAGLRTRPMREFSPRWSSMICSTTSSRLSQGPITSICTAFPLNTPLHGPKDSVTIPLSFWWLRVREIFSPGPCSCCGSQVRSPYLRELCDSVQSHAAPTFLESILPLTHVVSRTVRRGENGNRKGSCKCTWPSADDISCTIHTPVSAAMHFLPQPNRSVDTSMCPRWRKSSLKVHELT